MRMRLNALVLDLDGVLADTEPLHERAWDTVIAGIPPETVARARQKWVGMASADIARELISTFGLTQTVDEMLAEKRRRFRELLREDLKPFAGLAEELAGWKGVPLALATSATRVEALHTLERLSLPVVFDHVITCDDVARAKPAPDCYLLAAKLLKKRPEDCAAIEDSVHGMSAAVAAGLRVIAVSAAPLESLPDGVERAFPSTVEALRWLRNGSVRRAGPGPAAY